MRTLEVGVVLGVCVECFGGQARTDFGGRLEGRVSFFLWCLSSLRSIDFDSGTWIGLFGI